MDCTLCELFNWASLHEHIYHSAPYKSYSIILEIPALDASMRLKNNKQAESEGQAVPAKPLTDIHGIRLWSK